MDVNKITKRSKLKSRLITIRISDEISDWLTTKNYSPTGIFNEAIKDLGFKPMDVDMHGDAETNRMKLIRIMWNTNGWTKPSGNAGEGTGTYFSSHGFGHEEWLLKKRVIDGYRYGFLQPFYNVSRHIGKLYDVCLYTIYHKERFMIAKIKNVQILNEVEWKKSLEVYKEKGWFDSMQKEVESINGDTESFVKPKKFEIVNVKFKDDDVEYLCDPNNPSNPVERSHRIFRLHRYKVYDS